MRNWKKVFLFVRIAKLKIYQKSQKEFHKIFFFQKAAKIRIIKMLKTVLLTL